MNSSEEFEEIKPAFKEIKNIYQVKIENNKIKLVKVGVGDRVENLLLTTFNYENYECRVVNCVYENINIENDLDILSLVIYKNKKEIDRISYGVRNKNDILEFYIKNCKKYNKKIEELKYENIVEEIMKVFFNIYD